MNIELFFFFSYLSSFDKAKVDNYFDLKAGEIVSLCALELLVSKRTIHLSSVSDDLLF